MRWWKGVLLVLVWQGCSGNDVATDANCGRQDDSGMQLGLVPMDGGCGRCGFDVEGDPACAAAYPDLPSGCAAFCEGYCWLTCPGQSCTEEACDPAVAEACAEPSGDYALLYPCDPECGVGGGCRLCNVDSECERELGPTAICERHCGTCCRIEDNYDGPFPCLCT